MPRPVELPTPSLRRRTLKPSEIFPKSRLSRNHPGIAGKPGASLLPSRPLQPLTAGQQFRAPGPAPVDPGQVRPSCPSLTNGPIWVPSASA